MRIRRRLGACPAATLVAAAPGADGLRRLHPRPGLRQPDRRWRRAPHLPGTTTDFVPAGAEPVIDFELPDGQTYEQAGWTATGGLPNRAPVVGPARWERGHVGDKLLTTFFEADSTTGTLTSPGFTIDRNHLSLLVGAGGHLDDGTGRTVVELSVDGNRVRMTIYVDRSSVEVFGGAGQTTITDQIFPALGSDQTRLFAEGGDVLVRSLTVRPLRSVWR
ncbi:GH32 C-terminal domain-containing protein [Micromonospora globispora]|nr:GH32 C-terminal domain-containing protein [Micromonospora globispora]